MSVTRMGRPASRLPRLTYVLAAGTFLMGTSEFVVAGLLPDIARSFHLPIGSAGLSITVFAVGMIVGAPTMALATVRLPRRVTLTLALVVFAIGHVVVAITAAFPLLLLARFITALATGAFWSVASVVAAQAAGAAASSRALGIVLGGGMLANVLGVPLGAVVGQLIGWRGAFWGLAALAAMGALLIARTVPGDHPQRAIPSIRAELRVLRSARLWATLTTCATITFGVLALYSYISPILTDRAGAPGELVPVALALFGIGALIGNVVGGRLGDQRPLHATFIIAAATLVCAVALLLAGGSTWAVVVAFAFLGLVGLSANPILVSLAVRLGGDAPTLAAAMPTSIFNLGTALGSTAAALLVDTALGSTGPIIVGIVGALITFFPLSVLALLTRRAPVGHHS